MNSKYLSQPNEELRRLMISLDTLAVTKEITNPESEIKTIPYLQQIHDKFVNRYVSVHKLRKLMIYSDHGPIHHFFGNYQNKSKFLSYEILQTILITIGSFEKPIHALWRSIPNCGHIQDRIKINVSINNCTIGYLQDLSETNTFTLIFEIMYKHSPHQRLDLVTFHPDNSTIHKHNLKIDIKSACLQLKNEIPKILNQELVSWPRFFT